MKDKTKHTIAREIVFAVKLFLIFAIIAMALIFLSALMHDRDISKPVESGALFFFVFGIGYGYRLYKWVQRWK